MLLTATLLALAASPEVAPSLITTATVDRVRLPEGPAPGLAVFPFRAEVRLSAQGHARALALARAFPSRPQAPCAAAEVTGSGVTLSCRSRQVAAVLRRDSTGLWLDVRELRGISWDLAAGGLAAWQIAPPPCPAAALASSADCLLRAGATAQAEKLLQAGLKSADGWPFAALREGDLAAARGDLEGAVAQWKRAATAAGAEGRLARARLCQTSGACLTGRAAEQAHATAGLTEPQRTELELRRIQGEAASGHLGAAARLALARAAGDRRGTLGDGARDFLLELAMAGLTERGAGGRDDALALYLALRPPDEHPLALPLAHAAAEIAAAAGAPGYAARLLSSVTPAVSPAELPEHLQRCQQLYLRAADPVRAGMVLRYAHERLGPRALDGAAELDERPSRFRGRTPERGDQAVRALLESAAPTVEQASAVLALSRARRAAAGGPP